MVASTQIIYVYCFVSSGQLTQIFLFQSPTPYFCPVFQLFSGSQTPPILLSHVKSILIIFPFDLLIFSALQLLCQLFICFSGCAGYMLHLFSKPHL